MQFQPSASRGRGIRLAGIVPKVFHTMSYGLYLLSSQLDGRDNAALWTR